MATRRTTRKATGQVTRQTASQPAKQPATSTYSLYALEEDDRELLDKGAMVMNRKKTRTAEQLRLFQDLQKIQSEEDLPLLELQMFQDLREQEAKQDKTKAHSGMNSFSNLHAIGVEVGTIVKENVDKATRSGSHQRTESENALAHAALEETRRELMGDPESDATSARRERSERLRAAHGGGETRMTVVVSGCERPIRLDTLDTESDRLNALVRETREAAVNQRNQEMSRRTKIKSVAAEVDRLQLDRVALSLEVPHSTPRSWHSIIATKRRGQPTNLLHYVAPEKRRHHLRAIEQAAARSVEARMPKEQRQ